MKLRFSVNSFIASKLTKISFNLKKVPSTSYK